MELTQLRYFQVAANYEHISRAAEALNISQPALSTMITRLEKELNVPLFDHNGRSIVLNENGRRFLKRVNHILTEVDSSKRELQEMANEHDNTISLAVSSSQFLQGMHTFMYQHLDYKWHQRVADNKEIISLLNLGQIDMAVTAPTATTTTRFFFPMTNLSSPFIRIIPSPGRKASVCAIFRMSDLLCCSRICLFASRPTESLPSLASRLSIAWNVTICSAAN